jgi:hypothetical protein
MDLSLSSAFISVNRSTSILLDLSTVASHRQLAKLSIDDRRAMAIHVPTLRSQKIREGND